MKPDRQYLKVLRLEYWMKHASHEQIIDMGYQYTKPPSCYRDGYYYDRNMRFSWFEKDGIAYHKKGDGDNFKYCLSLANHQPLRPIVRQSIEILMQEGMADRKTRDLHTIDSDWHSIRNVYRDTMKFMFIHNEPKRSRS